MHLEEIICFKNKKIGITLSLTEQTTSTLNQGIRWKVERLLQATYEALRVTRKGICPLEGANQTCRSKPPPERDAVTLKLEMA